MCGRLKAAVEQADAGAWRTQKSARSEIWRNNDTLSRHSVLRYAKLMRCLRTLEKFRTSGVNQPADSLNPGALCEVAASHDAPLVERYYSFERKSE